MENETERRSESPSWYSKCFEYLRNRNRIGPGKVELPDCDFFLVEPRRTLRILRPALKSGRFYETNDHDRPESVNDNFFSRWSRRPHPSGNCRCSFRQSNNISRLSTTEEQIISAEINRIRTSLCEAKTGEEIAEIEKRLSITLENLRVNSSDVETKIRDEKSFEKSLQKQQQQKKQKLCGDVEDDDEKAVKNKIVRDLESYINDLLDEIMSDTIKFISEAGNSLGRKCCSRSTKNIIPNHNNDFCRVKENSRCSENLQIDKFEINFAFPNEEKCELTTSVTSGYVNPAFDGTTQEPDALNFYLRRQLGSEIILEQLDCIDSGINSVETVELQQEQEPSLEESLLEIIDAKLGRTSLAKSWEHLDQFEKNHTQIEREMQISRVIEKSEQKGESGEEEVGKIKEKSRKNPEEETRPKSPEETRSKSPEEEKEPRGKSTEEEKEPRGKSAEEKKEIKAKSTKEEERKAKSTKEEERKAKSMEESRQTEPNNTEQEKPEKGSKPTEESREKAKQQVEHAKTPQSIEKKPFEPKKTETREKSSIFSETLDTVDSIPEDFRELEDLVEDQSFERLRLEFKESTSTPKAKTKRMSVLKEKLVNRFNTNKNHRTLKCTRNLSSSAAAAASSAVVSKPLELKDYNRKKQWTNFDVPNNNSSSTVGESLCSDPSDFVVFRRNRKPTIVFIHGFGSSAEIFAHQLEYFSNLGYPCVAPDLLGHGMSSAPNRSRDYHFEKLLQDLDLVLHHYAFKPEQKCVLVAHNYGCSFATALACKYESSIHQLVLISGGGPTPLAPPSNESAGHCCLRAMLTPFLVCGLHRDILYSARGRQHPYCGSESEEQWPSHMKYVLKGMAWPEGDYVFHRRICTPTLLIHGLRDNKVSLVQECQMERTMIKAFLEALPSAGHIPMTDCPNQINHMIHCFIDLWKNKRW